MFLEVKGVIVNKGGLQIKARQDLSRFLLHRALYIADRSTLWVCVVVVAIVVAMLFA